MRSDTYSTRFAIAIASAVMVGAFVIVDRTRAADELPGKVCTAVMRLQNGGTVYFTHEMINYAMKMDFNDGAGKHITIAYNDMTKRKVLTRDGKTTMVESNADPLSIVEREFGPIKDKNARPENLMCSDKLFSPAYFDIK